MYALTGQNFIGVREMPSYIWYDMIYIYIYMAGFVYIYILYIRVSVERGAILWAEKSFYLTVKTSSFYEKSLLLCFACEKLFKEMTCEFACLWYVEVNHCKKTKNRLFDKLPNLMKNKWQTEKRNQNNWKKKYS